MSMYMDAKDNLYAAQTEVYYTPAEAFNNRWMTLGLSLYWFVFWLMNGFDKFCGRKELGLFNWYGTDRAERIATYFDRMHVNAALIKPAMVFSGLWELALAIPFIMAMDALFSRKVGTVDRTPPTLVVGLFFSILTMTVYSIFDILAGEQTELLAHGIMTALLIASYIAMQMERMFADVSKDLHH